MKNSSLFLGLGIVVIIFVAALIDPFHWLHNKDNHPSDKNFSLDNEVTKKYLLIQPTKITDEAVDIYGFKIDVGEWYMVDIKNNYSGLMPVAEKPIGSTMTSFTEKLKVIKTIKLISLKADDLTKYMSREKFKGIDSIIVALSAEGSELTPYKMGSGHIGIQLIECPSILSN